MIYLRGIDVRGERGAYPLNSESVLSLRDMRCLAPVVLLVGDNGSGKSTLLEALARALRLPSIGNEDAAQDHTLSALEPLLERMKLTFSTRARRGFFLRAEDFFGFTRRIAAMQRELRGELSRVEDEYAGRGAFAKGQARMAFAGSLHALNEKYGLDPDARSHGESFLHLFAARMNGPGLYILDEPEAPLSPLRQLSLIAMIMEREADSQFLIATHSPILMAYPGADIWSFDELPVAHAQYESLEHVRLTRDFLNAPERYLRRLAEPADDES